MVLPREPKPRFMPRPSPRKRPIQRVKPRTSQRTFAQVRQPFSTVARQAKPRPEADLGLRSGNRSAPARRRPPGPSEGRRAARREGELGEVGPHGGGVGRRNPAVVLRYPPGRHLVARQDHRTHRLERHPPRVSRHRCRTMPAVPGLALLTQLGRGTPLTLRVDRGCTSPPLVGPARPTPPRRQRTKVDLAPGCWSPPNCRQRSNMRPMRRSKSRPLVRWLLVCWVLGSDAGQGVDAAVA
jgi:hypothetical protein